MNQQIRDTEQLPPREHTVTCRCAVCKANEIQRELLVLIAQRLSRRLT